MRIFVGILVFSASSLGAMASLGCVVHQYQQPQPAPTPTGTTTPPATGPSLEGAPQGLAIQGTIDVGTRVAGTTPADAATAAAYAFAAPAGSVIQAQLERAVQGVELTLYGPLQQGESAGAVAPFARGDGPHTLPSDGTYIAGVSGPGGEIAFGLTLLCGSTECRMACGAENVCPSGSGCALIQCIRAPCVSYCEPFRGESPAAPGALGDVCGTRGAAPCQAGMFCLFEADANCGRADHPGTCVAVPQSCTGDYVPVCGCDGQTYPNACAAQANQVSPESTGACAP